MVFSIFRNTKHDKDKKMIIWPKRYSVSARCCLEENKMYIKKGRLANDEGDKRKTSRHKPDVRVDSECVQGVGTDIQGRGRCTEE